MIFNKPFHYDNSLVSIETEWSPYADSNVEVQFARCPFRLVFKGPREHFVQNFKEDFTAFYEKVMKDYDEVTGRVDKYEECFDAMIDDMTEINYRPESEEVVKDTEEQLRARFKAYENRIEYLEEMMCKELHKAYDMSISDISERLSIAESTVRYFVDGGE